VSDVAQLADAFRGSALGGDAHADWLLRHCPRPELWLRPLDGHVSVLDWLMAQNSAPLAS
jgi:hypothetical protein